MSKRFYFKQFSLAQIHSLNAKQSYVNQQSLVLFDL